ncbi:MAG: TIGR04076 family protein [Megasphaera sp.]|nr:TIGR04076 family protein [Megasphaera sp.]MCH4187755.1 TIGR04076 family protein [Megasphaera sp.]MCH4217808.1 TIGR04076 family protein [Megasphaera sp.]
MDVNKIKLVVMESKCDLYRPGDEIVFDGPVIDTKKSGALCMTALQALYPYVFAGRQGAVWESPIQCPDCAEKVVFRVEKIE